MDMTAKQTFDLRMPAYDVFKRSRLIGPAVATDVVIVDVERRMVDKKQGWAIRLFSERLVEPGLAFLAKASLTFAGQRRIDADQEHLMVLYRVMQKLAGRRHSGKVAERRTHFISIIAIARNYIEWRLKWRQ
jgi:hypothetical protein